MDAEKTLYYFLKCVTADNYKAAIKYVQITYRYDKKEAEIIDRLSTLVPVGIKSFKILSQQFRIDINDDVFKTYVVRIHGKDRKIYKSLINVICEASPYEASADGTWGVNPLSVIPKNLYSKNRRRK